MHWQAGKPGSVPPPQNTWLRGVDDGHLSRTTIACSLKRSTRESDGPSRPAVRLPGSPTSPLFDLASSGVYQASQVTLAAGELLPHRFTLTTHRRRRPFGGLFSVALSLTLRLVGVTDRSALRSPDFPLLGFPAATTWPANATASLAEHDARRQP